MSKLDAMRALREARYSTTPKPALKLVTTAAPAVTPRTTALAVAEPEAGPELCGHRSMNGRSCTRDLGHAEKNHRYG